MSSDEDTRRFFTYILRCADDTLYTGWTTDIEERLSSHNAGTGAKYTRTRTPVELLASWELSSKSEAMKLEHRIKQLPRQQKLQLVAEAE